MDIHSAVDLQPFNSLAVPACAQYFAPISDVCQLYEAAAWARGHSCPINILGGGSNIILRERVAGLTLHVQLKGREVLEQNADSVLLRVGAGENWHELVVWSLEKGFYGLENLALIPGTVGAAPVQNIGAYGVEVAQFIERVEGVCLTTEQPFVLSKAACNFGYRDSLFKREPLQKRAITHVVLHLPRKFTANLQYPVLASALEQQEVTAENVFAAVCAIRRTKLPDPSQVPNCGSFFKNPVVSEAQFKRLLKAYPQMPHFKVINPDNTKFRKLAAAWLIDQAGWKGCSRHGVCVHEAQALVLTNPNRCGSDAVLALAEEVRASVADRFAVSLELEPQIIGDGYAVGAI